MNALRRRASSLSDVTSQRHIVRNHEMSQTYDPILLMKTGMILLDQVECYGLLMTYQRRTAHHQSQDHDVPSLTTGTNTDQQALCRQVHYGYGTRSPITAQPVLLKIKPGGHGNRRYWYETMHQHYLE